MDWHASLRVPLLDIGIDLFGKSYSTGQIPHDADQKCVRDTSPPPFKKDGSPDPYP